MVDDELEDTEIEVNDWKNQKENNVPEKGRYKFKPSSLVDKNYVSKSGNICFVVEILIDGWCKKKCFLIKHDGEGKRTSMSHIYYNFLFALGIRNTNKRFSFRWSDIADKEGYCDVVPTSDGTDINIQNFSPIGEPTAPINDVPPENTSEKEEKPKKKKAEKKESESIDDL